MATITKPMPEIAALSRTHPQDVRDFHKALRDFLIANPAFHMNTHALGQFYVRTERRKLFWRNNTLYELPERQVVALKVPSRSSNDMGLFSAADSISVRLVGVLPEVINFSQPSMSLSLGGASANTHDLPDDPGGGVMDIYRSSTSNTGIGVRVTVKGIRSDSGNVHQFEAAFAVDRHGATFRPRLSIPESIGFTELDAWTIQPSFQFVSSTFSVVGSPVNTGGDDWVEVWMAKRFQDMVQELTA